ncbi:hypothetical protein B0A50_07050 [Salinomyces thailandicus]|uniref:Poly(A) polymerase n=1 Tax=Salinomyces thailandicus TaxID=706561 RepID=A0A4U0TP12_9PEZI|nr:hypothetical protein B0A50_07050 [Salinomyces thailandica]
MATEKQYGVTAPFSNDPPSAHDMRLNDALMAEFKAQNNFEPTSDTEKREAVLKKLEALLQRMVQEVGKKKGLPPGILETAGGKVFTYGSYRLGVYGPGSDVDTLMVGPKHVTRSDFFEYMPDLIRGAWPPEQINSMVPVPEIGTPIIKLEVRNVDIDLIYSALQLSAIPKDLDLKDDNLLRPLNDTDRRCVNGTRVTNRLLELVPQTKPFRLAVRAIKLWSTQRAVYGNIYGFPGGVAWAILVARVCQLYPKAAAPLLISKFFFIIKRWNWPKPVFLQNKEETSLSLREWDPVNNRADSTHLMPVLTPVYPSTNTTHTIGPSSKMIMMRELARGENIVNEIYGGKRQWKDLFQRHTFFTESYKHYISVVTAAMSKEALNSWEGLVKSKLKWLVKGIEDFGGESVELVHLFNKGFTREHECKTAEEIQKVFDGSLEYQVKETKTTEREGLQVLKMDGETEAERKGPTKVWTTTFYLGIGLRKGANDLDISMAVQNLQGDCIAWPQYDRDQHSIKTKHLRNFNLPDDVFVEGEVKPSRPKKKTAAAKAAEAASNKRSFSDTGLDMNADPAKRRLSANGSTPNGSTPQLNGNAG